MGASLRYERDSIEFARAISFFDATYAIALTLLVVNIEPPPAGEWTSLGRLLDAGLGSHLLGFAISFAVIAAFWRINHRLLAGVAAFTPQLISVSLVMLAFVVLIPFTTQGVSDPGTSDTPLAVALYAGGVSAAVVTTSSVYWVSRVQGLQRERPPVRIERISLLDSAGTVVVLLASIPIAYTWGPDAARISWIAILVLRVLSTALRRREARRPQAAA